MLIINAKLALLVLAIVPVAVLLSFYFEKKLISFDRRVRECNVYCEVKPYTTTIEAIKEFDPIGIIFTGGPNSVYLETSPQVDPEIFNLNIPIFGICYGCQLMAHHLGGLVTEAQDDSAREYGK
ncbi:MAG: gamma-glutamyl-gamma-aminobutyrate hydrolase family protein, partial [Clostridia bacterium]|nr:gamma-glutamyl-gamma-aminobutyrate hydrolase family protein [Clostridia bacterium]